jgi:hypothetical protein
MPTIVAALDGSKMLHEVTQNYLSRGRRFESLSDEDLLAVFIKEILVDGFNEIWDYLQDADSELQLRGLYEHWIRNISGTGLSELYRLDQVGSYVAKRCKRKSGVYRLVGLAEPGVNQPAILERVCGRDYSGTLYIGCADLIGYRLSQLVRSLREPRGCVYNTEHNAGALLRRNSLLSMRFPTSRLAVAWSYHSDYLISEESLLATYAKSFGELPPLNLKSCA